MSISPSLERQFADLSTVKTILLAGGKGTRLHELTASESKPAVLFAGRNRIIDFAMANVVRSGLSSLDIATQFAPQTLHDHIPGRWGNHFEHGLLSTHDGQGAFAGTADAVRKLWATIIAEDAEDVLVLAADHVYDMDYGALIRHHRDSNASVTIAVDVVPQSQAIGFGILNSDEDGRIVSFLEKPSAPPSIPGEPGYSLASMGIYVFSRCWLSHMLAKNQQAIDFGHHVIPIAVEHGEASAFRLRPAPTSNSPYWRDVGTLDALRVAQLDFIDQLPARLPNVSPAGKWSLGRGSVAMAGAFIGAGARLTNTIVAPDTIVPSGMVAGEDAEEDAEWYRVSAGGTILITQAMIDRRDALRTRKTALVVSNFTAAAGAETMNI